MTSRNRPVRGHHPWPQGRDHSDDGRETPAPRPSAPYTCQRGHVFAVPFAAEVTPPGEWACRCGAAATYDGPGPAATTSPGRGRSPPRMDDDPDHCMNLLLQRRTRAELEELLADRLTEIKGTA